MSADTFAAALKRERTQMKKSVHDIARQTSASVERVRMWESDEGVPSGIEFTRLIGLFHSLERFRRALNDERDAASRRPAPSQAPLTQRPLAVLALAPKPAPSAEYSERRETATALAIAPPALTSPPLANMAPPLPTVPPRSFGESLYQARMRAGLSCVELGQLVGTSANAVNSWERNVYVPAKNSLDELYRLLEPHGLTFRVSASRANAKTGPREPAPVGPPAATEKPVLSQKTADELKRDLAAAIAKVDEIRAEIAERRARLLAQAKELET